MLLIASRSPGEVPSAFNLIHSLLLLTLLYALDGSMVAMSFAGDEQKRILVSFAGVMNKNVY